MKTAILSLVLLLLASSPLGQGMARKRNPFPGETGIHPVCNGHNRLPHPGCGGL